MHIPSRTGEQNNNTNFLPNDKHKRLLLFISLNCFKLLFFCRACTQQHKQWLCVWSARKNHNLECEWQKEQHTQIFAWEMNFSPQHQSVFVCVWLFATFTTIYLNRFVTVHEEKIRANTHTHPGAIWWRLDQFAHPPIHQLACSRDPDRLCVYFYKNRIGFKWTEQITCKLALWFLLQSFNGNYSLCTPSRLVLSSSSF